MKHLIGMPDAVPAEVMTALIRRGKRDSFTVSFCDGPRTFRDAGVVVFTSVKALQANHIRLTGSAVVLDYLRNLALISNVRLVIGSGKRAIRELRRIIAEPAAESGLRVARSKEIDEALDRRKDIGLMHSYSTSLYRITAKPSREKIRELTMARLCGRISATVFLKQVQAYYPKRGKGLEAAQAIAEMVESEAGVKLRQAVEHTIKTKANPRRVSKETGVPAFDIRYVQSWALKALIEKDKP